jgi:hypothetical protein
VCVHACARLCVRVTARHWVCCWSCHASCKQWLCSSSSRSSGKGQGVVCCGFCCCQTRLFVSPPWSLSPALGLKSPRVSTLVCSGAADLVLCKHVGSTAESGVFCLPGQREMHAGGWVRVPRHAGALPCLCSSGRSVRASSFIVLMSLGVVFLLSYSWCCSVIYLFILHAGMQAGLPSAIAVA